MGAAELANYYVSPEEYLAGELLSEVRHEYLAGVVYAMAGASNSHNRIVANLVRELGNQLRGRRCEPFSTDIKVSICKGAAQFYYYPDVIVDCGGAADESYFAAEPRVIFEVLSKDTHRTDHQEKRENYQTLPSLDVYVLIDQFRMAVTVYRRAGDDWTTEFLTTPGEVLMLPTVECSLPLSVIYERTQIPS